LPDGTTPHPAIVRSLLDAGGFHCGVQPRILEGRDPNWTCIIDGQTISGDIYIHQQGSGASRSDILIWGGLAVLTIIVLIQAWIIFRQRRAARPANAA
jgi:hypothetical protein